MIYSLNDIIPKRLNKKLRFFSKMIYDSGYPTKNTNVKRFYKICFLYNIGNIMKKMSIRLIVMITVFVISAATVETQEVLKSAEEEYYDFLALQGLVVRPTLNYRTLSDSDWTLSGEAEQDEKNVWKNNDLGTKRQLSGHIAFRAYGPEWFNSYNTVIPYGQNDGALWQGKGYNSSLSAGARIEAYGFELTLKPQ